MKGHVVGNLASQRAHPDHAYENQSYDVGVDEL